MSARWHTYADPQAAAEACAHHIFSLLEESLAGQEFATLAVSGGATPKLLFEHMAPVKFNWSRVHLFFVDERAVPPTDAQSNFKLADDNLIAPAKMPVRNIHRVHAELTPDIAAARYAREIQDFFQLEEGQFPHFDVVHQGMGPDAHTASLFPSEPLINDREGIAAATYVEKMHSWRITLLPGVLLAAKHNVFLVTGEDKADAVRNVFEAEYDPQKYPAQIVTHHARRVSWFLDCAAARKVETK
jgi:6-phosphogluconolactonase